MLAPEQVTFLSCALSKPYFIRFFRASDFVVDQFFMGTDGTAAVEAMSCRTPVIMWIDEETFRQRGWEPRRC